MLANNAVKQIFGSKAVNPKHFRRKSCWVQL